jgi:hypothetical protein
MTTKTTWLTIGAAIVVAGCTAEAQRHYTQVDVHEIADSAVVSATHCASELDQMTVYSPESAWSALQADTSPNRAYPLPAEGRGALRRKGREEIARRLQAVLDSRTAVDRGSAHAGTWSWPLNEVGVAEHTHSLSQGLCRVRDAAKAMARRSVPNAPEAVSHLMTLEGARD